MYLTGKRFSPNVCLNGNVSFTLSFFKPLQNMSVLERIVGEVMGDILEREGDILEREGDILEREGDILERERVY